MINDRRTDHRLLLHSQVEITGVDDAGLQFVESSRLEDVSDLGCRFSIQNAVHRGSILGIEPLGPDGESSRDEYSRLFVVIWVKRESDRLMVGARSLLEDELSGVDIATNGSTSEVSAK